MEQSFHKEVSEKRETKETGKWAGFTAAPHWSLWGGREAADTCASTVDDLCFSTKISWAEPTMGFRGGLRNTFSSVPSTSQKIIRKMYLGFWD